MPTEAAEAEATVEEAPSGAPEDNVDDARQAAAGTRRTARWLASALGAIPSIGLITTLIQAPGEQGLNWGWLAFGVLLAAAGGALGIYAFANVLTPVPLTDSDLNNDTVKAVPGSIYTTRKELLQDLRDLSGELGTQEGEANDEAANAKGVEAEAALAEAAALRAEQESKENPRSDAKKRVAERLRAEADAKKREAEAATAIAASKSQYASFTKEQLTRRFAIKRDAYLLTASEAVGKRFKWALHWALPIAAALLSVGLIFLALSPKPKEEGDGGATVQLLELSLSPTGRLTLGCEVDKVRALQIGGDSKKPLVITLPSAACPESQVVEFETSEAAALGTAAEVEPVEAKTVPTSTSPTTTGEG
jgi:hypothetical protein